MAARFWVGGSGNWDASDTTHWSATTGGASGATVPSASDDVTLDASSGGGTVTVAATANCLSLTMGAFTGTLNTNGFALNCTGILSISGTGVRTVTLGASTINCGTWTATTVTNLTFNPNTSIIIQTGATTFNGGGLTYNEVQHTSTGTSTLAGANTFTNFRRTNASGYAKLYLSANQTVTSILVLTGNNANSQRMFVCASDSESYATGTRRTITCNGTITLTNVDFVDITGAGSGSWTGTSVGDCGNNSGITFTAAVTRYWVGNGGFYYDTTHWSTSSGGSTGASMPLPQDTANFDANSFSTASPNVDMFSGLRLGNVNFTGATNTPSFGHGTFYWDFYGSMTFISGMTVNSRSSIRGRGSHTVTMNGLVLGTSQIIIDAATGTYTLADNFSANTSFNWLGGNITAIGDVSLTGVFFNGSNTRTINMGNGLWTLTSTGPWSGSSFGGVSINAEKSTIRLTDNSVSNKGFGFSVGGQTYHKIHVATGGAGRVDFVNTMTVKEIRIDAGRAVRFSSGTTVTIPIGGQLIWQGGSAAGITVDSSSAGSPFTLSLASGVIDKVNYVSLKDSTASGGGTFYAGANSTNVSGNTGWTFTAPPAIKRREFLEFFA